MFWTLVIQNKLIPRKNEKSTVWNLQNNCSLYKSNAISTLDNWLNSFLDIFCINSQMAPNTSVIGEPDWYQYTLHVKLYIYVAYNYWLSFSGFTNYNRWWGVILMPFTSIKSMMKSQIIQFIKFLFTLSLYLCKYK